MLIFRNFKNEDYHLLKEFIGKENLDIDINSGLIYLALDNDRLIGMAKAIEDNEKWYLEIIYIVKDERRNGLGDGLFRAILNKLRNNAIEYIYYNTNSNYLINKGFCYNMKNQLELNIEKFFSTSSCGTCGG